MNPVVRYSYCTGTVGLVAQRLRRRPDLGTSVEVVEKFRYLGRASRAQRIVMLLRAQGRAA